MLLGYKQQQWSTGWWRWFPYVKQVLPKWKQKRKRVFLRLFLFQMEIQHEWKALAYVLNDVLRLDAAVAASQATWLVKNSNSVFRGCCCAQWAPGQGCGKEETGCAWTSPSPHVGQLVLGHPKVTGKGRHTCGVARKVYQSLPLGQKEAEEEQSARGISTLQANNSFKYAVSSPAHVPPTLLSPVV